MQTIQEAQEHLKKHWEEGTHCPCCKQFVKLYPRKITAAMAFCLWHIFKFDRTHPNQFVHFEKYLIENKVLTNLRGDFAKLKFWGLVEQMEGTREDSSKRIGLYRITEKGRDFVKGNIRVPSRVRLYNQASYGFDETEYITFKETLGNKFNYDELMHLIPISDNPVQTDLFPI